MNTERQSEGVWLRRGYQAQRTLRCWRRVIGWNFCSMYCSYEHQCTISNYTFTLPKSSYYFSFQIVLMLTFWEFSTWIDSFKSKRNLYKIRTKIPQKPYRNISLKLGFIVNKRREERCAWREIFHGIPPTFYWDTRFDSCVANFFDIKKRYLHNFFFLLYLYSSLSSYLPPSF